MLQLHYSWCTPHPVHRDHNLGFHTMDQFAVGIDKGLLGFNLGDDVALDKLSNPVIT